MPLVTLNGTTLYYEKQGTGVPIIFIHPPLLTSANFTYQQMQLLDRFTVITFDIRGHGRSHPSHAPITYSLIAEDINQLLNYLSIDKAFVAGYSTGGSIALDAIISYSDRFLGGILISAMPEASDFILRSRIRIAMGLSSWKPALRLLMLGITWGNADSKLTFRNLWRDSLNGNIENIHQYYKFSLNYNCTQLLSHIKLPILLLYGEKDWGFKRYLKKLQQSLRQFDVVTFQKERHQLPTKAAVALNEVISNWIHKIMNEYYITDAILDESEMERNNAKTTEHDLPISLDQTSKYFP